jgi:hypothetical protein
VLSLFRSQGEKNCNARKRTKIETESAQNGSKLMNKNEGETRKTHYRFFLEVEVIIEERPQQGLTKECFYFILFLI